MALLRTYPVHCNCYIVSCIILGYEPNASFTDARACRVGKADRGRKSECASSASAVWTSVVSPAAAPICRTEHWFRRAGSTGGWDWAGQPEAATVPSRPLFPIASRLHPRPNLLPWKRPPIGGANISPSKPAISC